MWLSSDVGTAAHQLKKEFDHETWDFSELSDVWWYTDEMWKEKPDWRQPGTYVHAGEPEDAFRERLERFKDWIKERPEDTIGDDPSLAPVTCIGYTKTSRTRLEPPMGLSPSLLTINLCGKLPEICYSGYFCAPQ
jgi:hypothetical protein